MRLLLLAASALTMLTPAGSSAAQQIAQPVMGLIDGTILDIVAQGRTTRVPDIAIIRAGIVTQAVTAADALSENAQRMDRVLAALKRAGVADRDVQTATIALSSQYRYGENQPPTITGYQASNNVSVRFRDVVRSGTILDALVREGANQIDGPNLSIDKPDAALDEARGDAIARARARAELYARATGMRIDRIISISEDGGSGAFPPPPMPPMMMARGEAMADSKIVAGEREVAVSVSVRFLLK